MPSTGSGSAIWRTAPRAVPVPITGGQDGVDSVVSQSLLVENTLPEGSNWDGKTGLLVDEKTFNELVGGQSPKPAPRRRPKPRLKFANNKVARCAMLRCAVAA
jgi:hypothetical protein